MKIFIKIFIAIFLMSNSTVAQTILATGDLVFTGYQSSGPTTNTDQFAFVTLKSLSVGTVIKFTDNAWNSNTVTFNTTESIITFTVNPVALPAGTQIRIILGPPAQAQSFSPLDVISFFNSNGTAAGTVVVTGIISLPVAGDQIIAYQGPDLAPTTFISGIHMNVEAGCGITTASGWDPASCVFPTSPSNNTSMKPAALTTGVNAFWSPVEHDNGKFNGCGLDLSTPAAVRTAVNNPANWIFDDAISSIPPAWGLTMSGCPFLCSIDLTSAVGTNVQTVCINSPITNIIYSNTPGKGTLSVSAISGSTGSGIPLRNILTGVSDSWADDVLTISGTPTVAGTFTYSLAVAGGSCMAPIGFPTTGTITVKGATGGTVANNQSISFGGNPAVFTQTIASIGSGALTFQWQSSITSCNAGFSDILGATETTYDPPTGLTQTTFYRRVTTSTLNGVPCRANSNCITVTVSAPPCSITLNSTDTLNSTPARILQRVCINTPITNITYSTTGATGATFNGLPTGVIGNWAVNVVTISGTPTVSGTFNYTVTLTGGSCTPANISTGSIIVKADCTIPLNTSASNITATTAHLSWMLVNCATGYTVQYHKSNSSNFTTVEVNSNIGFLDISGLQKNSNYVLQIKTKCTSTLTSSFSAEVIFSTLNH